MLDRTLCLTWVSERYPVVDKKDPTLEPPVLNPSLRQLSYEYQDSGWEWPIPMEEDYKQMIAVYTAPHPISSICEYDVKGNSYFLYLMLNMMRSCMHKLFICIWIKFIRFPTKLSWNFIASNTWISFVVHLIHLFWRWNKTIVGKTLWPCIQSWSTGLYPLKYFLIYICRQLLSVPMLTFPNMEILWNQFAVWTTCHGFSFAKGWIRLYSLFNLLAKFICFIVNKTK